MKRTFETCFMQHILRFYAIHMAHKLPLSALLSQALVAFIIEFDNEFEHQTPHRTTNHDSSAESGTVPWLVSMAMWVKFLRFVPDSGITLREFQNLAALPNKEAKMWLTRLSQWWGYITIDKGAEDPFNWLIRPTPGGKKALQVWRPLTGVIETRWRERFGKETVDELCQSMLSLVRQFNPKLPDYLSILGYEMLSSGPHPGLRDEAKPGTPVTARHLLSHCMGHREGLGSGLRPSCYQSAVLTRGSGRRMLGWPVSFLCGTGALPRWMACFCPPARSASALPP